MRLLFLKNLIFKVLEYSIVWALKSQNLFELFKQLKLIVPDISKQYSTFTINGSYLETKVRGQHAFQLSLANKAIKMNDKRNSHTTIVDIGDSSGTHLKYLKSIHGEINAISVNSDPIAVEKIRSAGLNAIESRAELLNQNPDFNSEVDIFLSFEMLEHLLNPIDFLYQMSTKSNCKYFVITIPFLRKSRVGLHQLRNIRNKADFNAERTHIFELSDLDWNLIFNFSGWKVVYSKKYLQYPKFFPANLLKYPWRKIDFEGFYGVILEIDHSTSSRYKDF
jgi:2-polyprenyl-3-methyl-5-hydroxy-6-metoxy-1,4-benzoquinol methylase